MLLAFSALILRSTIESALLEVILASAGMMCGIVSIGVRVDGFANFSELGVREGYRI